MQKMIGLHVMKTDVLDDYTVIFNQTEMREIRQSEDVVYMMIKCETKFLNLHMFA